MSLLRAASRHGITPPFSIPQAFQTCPASIGGLIRVLNLPAVDGLMDGRRLCDYEAPEAQGLSYAYDNTWFLMTASRIHKLDIWARRSGKLLDIYELNQLRDFMADTDLGGGCQHISDGDYHRGVLFVVVNHESGRPLILGLDRFLHTVGYAWMNQGWHSSPSGNACCAVNPWNHFLYIPERGHTTSLHAYDVAGFYERAAAVRDRAWGTEVHATRLPAGDLHLYAPSGEPAVMPDIQGIVFSPNGRLYAAYYRKDSSSGPWHNFLAVYNALTGFRTWKSDEIDYPGAFARDEIEGITIRPGDPRVYVAVNVNALHDYDDAFQVWEYRIPERSLVV